MGIYPLKGYLKIFGWLRIGLAVFFIAPPMGFVGEDGAVTGVFDVIKLELPNIAGKNFGEWMVRDALRFSGSLYSLAV